MEFFAYSLFQILEKVYLQVLKNLAQFFAYPLFQILKKYPFHNNDFKGNNLHKNHYTNQ